MVLLGCISLSFLLYAFSLHGAFVRDDFLYADRTDLHTKSALWHLWGQSYTPLNNHIGVYRPLTLSTFAINFIVFGGGTTSFHVVNVILNGVVIWLVFLLVQALFDDDNLAILAALLFAFLPIHTEAIAFVKSRDEILAALFGLLSWLSFIYSQKKKKLKYLWLSLSSAFFVLTLLSKETLLTLPAIFILVAWLRGEAKKIKELIAIGLIYAVPLIPYFFLRWRVLGPSAFGNDNALYDINPLKDAGFITRFATGCKLAFLMLGKTLLPLNLTATYNFNSVPLISNVFSSWEAVVGLLMLLALLFAAIWPKFPKMIRVGSIVLLVSYFMVSKFLFSGGEITGERWMYFPSIGLVLIGAYLLEKAFKKKEWIGLAILAPLLAWYGYAAINRNLAWINQKTLGESMIKTSPNSVVSYLSLAGWYYTRQEYPEAEKVIDRGKQVDPHYPPLQEFVGQLEFKKHNYEAAAAAYRDAIEHHDQEYFTFVSYAQSLTKAHHYLDAIDLIDNVLKPTFKDPQLEFIKSVCYFRLGNNKKALEYFDWGPNLTLEQKWIHVKEY